MNGMSEPLVDYLFPGLNPQTVVLISPFRITYLELPVTPDHLVTEARASEDGLMGCALAFNPDLDNPSGMVVFFDLD